MCLGGGGSAKVSVPKPPPLPPPLPPPPPPKPEVKKPQVVQNNVSAAPDIRIGAAKGRRSTSSRPRNSATGTGKQSLSIGSNQGLNI